MSEVNDALNQLLLGFGLDFSPEVLLHLMPHVLNRVHVRTLRRRPPPVDSLLLEEINCTFGGMLRIIVLHEQVAIRVHLTDKWQKCFFQNCNVECCVHYAVKYAYPCSSP